MKTARACKHCDTMLRSWTNNLGSTTFWCDECDSKNTQGKNKVLVPIPPPWPGGRQPE